MNVFHNFDQTSRKITSKKRSLSSAGPNFIYIPYTIKISNKSTFLLQIIITLVYYKDFYYMKQIIFILYKEIKFFYQNRFILATYEELGQCFLECVCNQRLKLSLRFSLLKEAESENTVIQKLYRKMQRYIAHYTM